MSSEVQISNVSILSIDKSEDSWAIEGEILFEEDLSSDFAVTYILADDELEDFILEINPGVFDYELLKEMILEAAMEYEE